MFLIVPTKPEFSVNEKSEIMWNATKRVISQRKDKDGYLRCTYRTSGKSHHIAPHRAVAEVFVENKDPEGCRIVNHIDGVKDNNLPSNLEWTNPRGNRIHAQVIGSHHVVGDAHSQNKIGSTTAHRICHLLEEGLRQVDVANAVGVDRHIVTAIKRGKSWTHISKEYKLTIPRKETISLSSLSWLSDKINNGECINHLLDMNPRYDRGDISRIKNLLALVKRND